jgi:hypothetical protein
MKGGILYKSRFNQAFIIISDEMPEGSPMLTIIGLSDFIR